MATKVKLIETGAVTGNIIPDGGIATVKLANDAVTTIKISDANITHAKLHTSMDLTGKTVTVATAAGSTNTTAAASTAFVQQELTTLIGGAPSTLNDLNELAAAINDDSNYNSTLTTALATKLPLAGGTMTGDLITTGLTVDTTTLVVDKTNNRVGIGTATANRKLEIAGNNNGGAKANYIRITDTDTSATLDNQQGGIEFYTNDNSPGIAASMEVLYAGSGGGGEITFNTAAHSTAGVLEAVRIDASGNVGIGDTSPSVKLDVYQSTVGTGAADFRHVNGNRILLNPSYNYHDAYNHIFRGLNGTNTHMTIDNNGNVGIGTTSAAVALEIGLDNSSTSVGYIRLRGHNTVEGNIYKDATYSIHMDTNSNNGPIRIDGSKQILGITGNVGIGTESPAKKLHVRTTADGTLQRFSRHGVCDWDVSIGNTPIITGGSAGDLEIMPQNANMGFAVGRAGQTGINMRVRDGVMTLGSGIKFNGDTAAANELDDYEEGTWIPDLRNSTTSLSTQTWAYGPMATYTKVGDLVYIHLAGKLSSVAGTGGGELRIFGLPFMPQTTGGYQEHRINFILGNSVNASDSAAAFAFVRNGGTDLGTRLLTGGDTVFTSNRIDSDTFFSCYGCYKT